MFRSIAMVLIVGGILMIVLPWLASRYYIGPLALTNLLVRTQSGDPELFVELADMLDNCITFGVLTTLTGVVLASIRSRKVRE